MKHDFETLQHVVYFMCVVSCMKCKSVQHLSATCATHFSETKLVNTMQQDHEMCET